MECGFLDLKFLSERAAKIEELQIRYTKSATDLR